MRFLIISICLFVLAVIPAQADIFDDIAAMRAEVKQAKSNHDLRLSYSAAPKTLEQAFASEGVVWAMRYTSPWGSWLFLDWRRARGFHDQADNTLKKWDQALRTGAFDPAAVGPALAVGLQAFQVVDRDMQLWFDGYISRATTRAQLLDRAQSSLLAGNRELYDYYSKLAEDVRENVPHPLPEAMGAIVVFPAVPEAGQPIDSGRNWAFTLADRAAQRAITSGTPGDLRAALAEARSVLRRYPDPQSQELVQVLSLLEERARFAEAPVAAVLDQAQAMAPGPLRDALLDAAQDDLMDRIGHLAPLIAAGAETEADQEDAIMDMLTLAQRITKLRDDLEHPFDKPSGLLRSVNGLRAAAGLMNLASSDDPRAKDIMEVINDAAGTFPTLVTPTAPFAAPAGAVAAQLDQTRQAWDHASDAMQGVADAISGDANGVARAQQAAARLRTALSPRAFVRNMSDGFVDGLVSNVPFARSIVSWLRD
ncbi:MAG: hypothetical protein ABJN26_08165 [Stappiaceae bacterium]